MNELKNCPLCGEKVQFEQLADGQRCGHYYRKYGIVCNQCKLCTEPIFIDMGYTPEKGCWVNTNELNELVSKWNTRV